MESMAKSPNPLDEYLETREKTASRDEKHLELWQTWKADPNPKTLQPLLQEFQPTFNSYMKQWRAPRVNEAAFRADMQSHAIRAFENYDPNRGASLSTHVIGRIQKSKRFNTQGQNLAYIPEGKARFIGPIDSAADRLRDDLGREPTHQEIGLEVGLSAKRVKEIQGLRRADITGSSFATDPVGHIGSRDREIISLLRPELTPDEQVVYDYLYGQGGKPKLESTGAIATRIGRSASHVSRIKNRIAAKYNKYSK